MNHVFQREIAGRTLRIESGKLAQQANGAVTIRYGDSQALVTAVISPRPREGIDFLPLTVDYEERLYAAGKIPGSFFRREGRPSQEAILAMRLTDRPIRPLFPKGLRNEIQIIVTVLSADQENDPDLLSIIGTSAALSISTIPFKGPLGACRIGYANDQLVVNPTFQQLEQSKLELVIAGTRDTIVMVEAGAREVPEELILQAMKMGQTINAEIVALQEEMVKAIGRPKIAIAVQEGPPPELQEKVRKLFGDEMEQILAQSSTKGNREGALAALESAALEKLSGELSADKISAIFQDQLKALIRARVLDRGLRPDGRGLKELRPVSCEVGLLPRTHGSGLFTRGQTQVLTITTLGSVGQKQKLDTIGVEEKKRFLHHYNFLPFSTGEVRRMVGPGRREIGHGALAERALLPVIPSEEDFTYTIRLVSEVLSSNGSTSMASVCGSALSLMDAGVPIKAPVAGVAMGLVKGDGRFAIMTDIAGVEDALGDMDFKVAGTAAGVTALQMDTKTQGISLVAIEQALVQAREGRLAILQKMQETIAQARPELSKYAPRMIRISINPEKIGSLIGPGGKTIRSIIEATKVTLDVENDGTVYIGSTSEERAQKALEMIEQLTRDAEVGVIYTGKVTRIVSFGAFVEVLPGKEGLVPTGELADHQVSRVEDVVKIGDEITVMVTEIDRMGRINLSRRAVAEGLSGAVARVRERAQGPRDRDRGERFDPRRRSGPPRGDRVPRFMPRGPNP